MGVLVFADDTHMGGWVSGLPSILAHTHAHLFEPRDHQPQGLLLALRAALVPAISSFRLLLGRSGRGGCGSLAVHVSPRFNC